MGQVLGEAGRPSHTLRKEPANDFRPMYFAHGADLGCMLPSKDRAMRLITLACGLCLLAGTVVAATDEPFRDFADLPGSWICHGVFPASGKTIDSSVRFERDLAGKALVKHHDDTSPPALYHAVEAWGYDAKTGHYNAVVLDNFGGARVFTAEGWHDNRLTWNSAPEVKPAQRFVYIRMPQNHLRIDWEVERDGKQVVGDTLDCTRAAHNDR